MLCTAVEKPRMVGLSGYGLCICITQRDLHCSFEWGYLTTLLQASKLRLYRCWPEGAFHYIILYVRNGNEADKLGAGSAVESVISPAIQAPSTADVGGRHGCQTSVVSWDGILGRCVNGRKHKPLRTPLTTISNTTPPSGVRAVIYVNPYCRIPTIVKLHEIMFSWREEALQISKRCALPSEADPGLTRSTVAACVSAPPTKAFLCRLSEFRQILSSDVIDREKLRQLCFHGMQQ